MPTTDGIEAVFLATHNRGKAAKFFRALGYELELDTGHHSGQLRNGSGPYVFSPFADTHWGTRAMVVRDPDGRQWSLQASSAAS